MVEWRTVEVEVSNEGQIRFLGTDYKPTQYRPPKPGHRRRAPYQRVQFSVHRLVCAAFHGLPTKERAHVNHIDCDPSNNRADNLEWVSPKENRNRTPNGIRGERCHTAKLTSDVIPAIRAARPLSGPEMARKHGVSLVTIWNIRRRPISRKLSADAVAEIHAWRSPGEVSNALATEHGVTPTAIWAIWNGSTWKHVS